MNLFDLLKRMKIKSIITVYPFLNQENKAKLNLYQVNAITKGTDAQAEVTVKLEQDDKSYVGKGADLDTLVASAKAYLHSLNKIYIKSENKLSINALNG